MTSNPSCGVKVLGTGSAVPNNVLDNETLAIVG